MDTHNSSSSGAPLGKAWVSRAVECGLIGVVSSSPAHSKVFLNQNNQVYLYQFENNITLVTNTNKNEVFFIP